MISLLTEEDVDAWRAIRLEALLDTPVAFTESYEAERDKTDEEVRAGIRKSTIFAWHDENGTLAGTLGFYVLPYGKARHRGHLFAMYVRPGHRGKGIASRLMEAAIAHAQTCVLQLHLGVDGVEGPALSLYRKYGFEIYGTDPRAICIDGAYYDEHLMVKMLGGPR